MDKKVTLLGAGLVGSLLALYLAKRGYHVDVFERRSDFRKKIGYEGRSINLAMSDRGLRALKHVGLEEAIREIAIPMLGRGIHDLKGELSYQPYGLDDSQFINSVSRGDLNVKLINEAEKFDNVRFIFDAKCNHVDFKTQTITFENESIGTTITHKYDLLFGSDGAFSALRLNMMLQTDKFDYAQDFLPQGYKELTIPAGKNGEFLLSKNALHIWPRGKFMLIALPNLDGSFTCTLFFPFEGETSFASIKTDSDLIAFFTEYFPDALPLMPTLIEDFFKNPSSSLITVKCLPWIRDNKVALIGDAAHAIVPFYGQGMNCGFEDCYVLDQLIEKHNHDWEKILPEYESLRKIDGDAIADLAKENFIEMRDKVGDANFLLQKKIEVRIAKRQPEKWLPLYNMVTFSQMRYSDALKNGRKQEAFMKEIMRISNIENTWETAEIDQIIDQKLTQIS